MKLYKMFDQNGIYPTFWSSDVEKVIDDWEDYAIRNPYEYDIGYTAELRSFDTWDIDTEEYHEIDEDDYFASLSKLEKTYTLTEDGDFVGWEES